jgi:hypothetical protein
VRKYIEVKASITAEAKQKAQGIIYDSALKILEPILIDQLDKNGTDVLHPDPNFIVRSMNRVRQSSRPPNPTNLFSDK